MGKNDECSAGKDDVRGKSSPDDVRDRVKWISSLKNFLPIVERVEAQVQEFDIREMARNTASLIRDQIGGWSFVNLLVQVCLVEPCQTVSDDLD